MELPQNARVIVVDNEPEDVSDLLACLAKEGVATLYYKGFPDFPGSPLSGLRLLFLDLELEGLSGQGDKTKVSTAKNIYRSLVAADNGPLVLILWTKHGELYDQVRSAIIEVAQNPVFIGCMEKADCQDQEHYSTDLIRKKLDEIIIKADVFGLYISWENVVHKATVNQAARLSSIAGTGELWAEHMSYALFRMYKAYAGKNQVEDVKQQLASALLLYNECFSSEIANALNNLELNAAQGFRLKASGLPPSAEEQLRSKINATLLYNFRDCPPNEPGAVHLIHFDEGKNERLRKLKSAIIEDFTANGDNLCDSPNGFVSLCKVVITPQCDVSQKKCMQEKKSQEEKGEPFSRVVWGLFVSGEENCGKIKQRKFDRCYSAFMNFEYDKRRCALLIDLDTVELDVFPQEHASKIFVLNSIPLADIRTKAANVLNRVGVSSAD